MQRIELSRCRRDALQRCVGTTFLRLVYGIRKLQQRKTTDDYDDDDDGNQVSFHPPHHVPSNTIKVYLPLDADRIYVLAMREDLAMWECNHKAAGYAICEERGGVKVTLRDMCMTLHAGVRSMAHKRLFWIVI